MDKDIIKLENGNIIINNLVCRKIKNLTGIFNILDNTDVYLIEIKNQKDYNAVLNYFCDSHYMGNYTNYRRGKQLFIVTDGFLENIDIAEILNELVDSVKEIISA
jgi:hypothetical protein